MRKARLAAEALFILAGTAIPGFADMAGVSFSLHVLPWFPGAGSHRETLSPADVDRDGDMDFFTGHPEGADWMENLGSAGWRRHGLSDSTNTDVGAFALDVDGDGWTDRVSGSFWYRNPATSGGGFRAIRYGLFEAVHDLYPADVDGDGRWDVVTLKYTHLFWLRRPADPAAPSGLWEQHSINEGAAYADQHGGLALGDIDGDGDADLFSMGGTNSSGTPKAYIWENRDGQGTAWKEHVVFEGRAGHDAAAADFDGDGDLDIVSKAFADTAHFILENRRISGTGLLLRNAPPTGPRGFAPGCPPWRRLFPGSRGPADLQGRIRPPP